MKKQLVILSIVMTGCSVQNESELSGEALDLTVATVDSQACQSELDGASSAAKSLFRTALIKLATDFETRVDEATSHNESLDDRNQEIGTFNEQQAAENQKSRAEAIAHNGPVEKRLSEIDKKISEYNFSIEQLQISQKQYQEELDGLWWFNSKSKKAQLRKVIANIQASIDRKNAELQRYRSQHEQWAATLEVVVPDNHGFKRLLERAHIPSSDEYFTRQAGSDLVSRVMMDMPEWAARSVAIREIDQQIASLNDIIQEADRTRSLLDDAINYMTMNGISRVFGPDYSQPAEGVLDALARVAQEVQNQKARDKARAAGTAVQALSDDIRRFQGQTSRLGDQIRSIARVSGMNLTIGSIADVAKYWTDKDWSEFSYFVGRISDFQTHIELANAKSSVDQIRTTLPSIKSELYQLSKNLNAERAEKSKRLYESCYPKF